MKEEVEALKKRMNQLVAMHNRAAGKDAATRLVISAMAAQIPNKRKALQDFSEQLEDTNVRTMFSSMPESFYESVQEAGAVWSQVLWEALRNE